ncbi:MAG: tetratricopeptide repeat protein [Treponema sp.]|jgi:Ca-activated chloride channel family protein|nr:tetratricopeptide repeat protein [Treponema sp.]
MGNRGASGFPAGALLILLGASVFSCSPVSGKLLLMGGNFFNSQGMYTEAISSYLEALRFPETVPYAEYGLGSVYLSMGEDDAALQRFSAAEAALRTFPREDHRELLYRIHYNTGIARFQGGDFTGAAAQFREALETDSGRIEAKRNLELSLLFLIRQNAAAAASSPSVDIRESREGPRGLFDYLRRKEQDQWKSREWLEDTVPSGPDY